MSIKTFVQIAGIAIAAIIISLLLEPPTKTASGSAPSISVCTAPTEIEPLITHAQDVWISALEWCESRARSQAINPKDRDNTPSYGAFQFKPATFAWYSERYDLPIPKVKSDQWTFMDYEAQRQILERMISDKAVIWSREFPDCVKKLGAPPAY